MKPRRAAASLLVTIALTLAAGLLAQSTTPKRQPAAKPGASAPPSRAPRPVPFAVGETLTYHVSWASLLTAGEATLKVVERKSSNRSEAYYIVAEGRPAPLLARLYALYYKVDTLLDVYSLLPQRASLYSEEGRRHHFKVTTFDRAAKKARFEVEGSPDKPVLAIDRDSQDPLAALFVLRSATFKNGDHFTIPICDGGLVYTLQVNVGGVEPVKTPLGTIRAWRITPVLPDNVHAGAKGLTVWISDDARRLPVKIQAQLAVGSFELTLAKSPGTLSPSGFTSGR